MSNRQYKMTKITKTKEKEMIEEIIEFFTEEEQEESEALVGSPRLQLRPKLNPELKFEPQSNKWAQPEFSPALILAPPKPQPVQINIITPEATEVYLSEEAPEEILILYGKRKRAMQPVPRQQFNPSSSKQNEQAHALNYKIISEPTKQSESSNKRSITFTFSSKEEAQEFTQELQARGYRSISAPEPAMPTFFNAKSQPADTIKNAKEPEAKTEPVSTAPTPFNMRYVPATAA